MFDLLMDWIHYQFTFFAETEHQCPACDDAQLVGDIMDDVFHCLDCGSKFTVPDEG
jgi:ribosomal protein L37AE/L43A